MSSVIVVPKQMGHHGAYSGYQRLVNYLPECACFSEPAPRSLLRVFNLALRKYCRPTWYGANDFAAECGAMWEARSRDAKVLHFLYGEDQYWVSGFFRLCSSTRVAATFHQPASEFDKFFGARDRLKQLDAALVVSKSQVEIFEPYVGRRNVHVVPHGVDTDFFQPPKVRTAHPRGIRTCLVVGSWLRCFSTLDEILKIILRTRSNVRFVIVSGSTEARDLQKNANVEIRAGISDMELRELYQTSDLTVLPLKQSTANNALVESLACGTPVIATNVGGVCEYLKGSSGILVESNNACLFAEAIISLLNDDSRLDAMRQAAAAFAKRFDWRIVCEQVRSIYASLAN